MDLKGVAFQKRMYIYKHYILFSNLADRGLAIRNVPGILNKIICAVLWIPGTIETKRRFKKEVEDTDENSLIEF